MTRLLPLAFILTTAVAIPAAENPPVYLRLEPERFDGVKGHFAYWTGEAKPTGSKAGTLVVNVNAARRLPKHLLGLRIGRGTHRAESWEPTGGEARPATPFGVVGVVLTGAVVLALADSDPLVTRHRVGAGSVIVTLVPRMIGLDERAHPALPWLMNGLTAGVLPVEVRMPVGSRPAGEILYLVNKTKDGYLVLLMNNRGVDKTQSDVARVDRRQSVDVVVRTALPVTSAKEFTEPRDLAFAGGQVRVTVHPGDVQVVYLVTQ
jgi:hypothetical protein